MKLENYIQLSGPLFEAVQTKAIFSDPKTFVDAIPREDPQEIIKHYSKKKREVGFDLKDFVSKHFDLPQKVECPQKPKATMSSYISSTWKVLFKDMSNDIPYSTLIPLPHPHPVPGERFGECFYWDSYFTALGLATEGRVDQIVDMVDNFASLIDRFGFIPNGNRVYFLSRSQPPYFSFLIELLIELGEKETAKKYVPALEKEYHFWMKGSELLSLHRRKEQHTVLTKEGDLLNRYWDRLNIPRPEAYAKEVALGKELNHKEGHRELRAVCASGWDFSSRWFKDPNRFDTLCALDLAPVDLNTLLYHVEMTLSTLAHVPAKERNYLRLANKRKQLIRTLFWDEKKQFFFDYNWREERLSSSFSLAAAMPLFLNIATEHQANCVAHHLEKEFLLKGGFVTTRKTTGHQWDAPNGWAPLQWIAIKGLLNYGYGALAQEGGRRWLKLNEELYNKHGAMFEKYNVLDCSCDVARGFYAPQRGFGWTNGVALALMHLLTPAR